MQNTFFDAAGHSLTGVPEYVGLNSVSKKMKKCVGFGVYRGSPVILVAVYRPEQKNIENNGAYQPSIEQREHPAVRTVLVKDVGRQHHFRPLTRHELCL